MVWVLPTPLTSLRDTGASDTGQYKSIEATARMHRAWPAYTLTTMAIAYSFSAILGQGEMKLATLIVAVVPAIKGNRVSCYRDAGKSTAVRAPAALLPKKGIF